MQVDSDSLPVIDTKTLMEKFLHFDWTGGHSGRVLDKESAGQLKMAWYDYLDLVCKQCSDTDAFIHDDIEVEVECDGPVQLYLTKKYGKIHCVCDNCTEMDEKLLWKKLYSEKR